MSCRHQCSEFTYLPLGLHADYAAPSLEYSLFNDISLPNMSDSYNNYKFSIYNIFNGKFGKFTPNVICPTSKSFALGKYADGLVVYLKTFL